MRGAPRELFENEYINFLIEHFFVFCYLIFRLNEIRKNNVLKYLIMSFPFNPKNTTSKGIFAEKFFSFLV